MIIGANNASAMLFAAERATRYSIGQTLPAGYRSVLVTEALQTVFDQVPHQLLKSVTLDLGSEWANTNIIADEFGIDIWRCNPHSPWARGQIENNNRAWRWWFPRGVNLAVIAQRRVDHAVNLINNQPRRSLNNQTPAHLYAKATSRTDH